MDLKAQNRLTPPQRSCRHEMANESNASEAFESSPLIGQYLKWHRPVLRDSLRRGHRGHPRDAAIKLCNCGRGENARKNQEL